MSGHNKWSKVKNKKAASDSKKSKLFSIHVKQLTFESKKAGGNLSSPGLKAAIAKAKSVNMPQDNIERAVKRGVANEPSNLSEVLYEVYGPGGVALLVTGITDNKNRTSSEIKHILSTEGLTLAEPGSASWAFAKDADGWKAKSTLSISKEDVEKLMSLINTLSIHDDISAVISNAEL